MFTVALLIVPNWKQPKCPSRGEGRNSGTSELPSKKKAQTLHTRSDMEVSQKKDTKECILQDSVDINF